jgi:hypothetical protein
MKASSPRVEHFFTELEQPNGVEAAAPSLAPSFQELSGISRRSFSFLGSRVSTFGFDLFTSAIGTM